MQVAITKDSKRWRLFTVKVIHLPKTKNTVGRVFYIGLWRIEFSWKVEDITEDNIYKSIIGE